VVAEYANERRPSFLLYSPMVISLGQINYALAITNTLLDLLMCYQPLSRSYISHTLVHMYKIICTYTKVMHKHV